MMRIQRLQVLAGWSRLGCVALLGAFLLGCSAEVPTEGASEVAGEVVSSESVMAKAAAIVSEAAQAQAVADDAPRPAIRVHAPRVEGQPSRLLSRPLIILDAVALSPEEAADEARFMALTIKSIEVLDGAEAISRFGESGANGVVLVVTRD
jgi:hypothetical protein